MKRIKTKAREKYELTLSIYNVVHNLNKCSFPIANKWINNFLLLSLKSILQYNIRSHSSNVTNNVIQGKMLQTKANKKGKTSNP